MAKQLSSIFNSRMVRSIALILFTAISTVLLLAAGGRETELEMAETSPLRRVPVAADGSGGAPPSLIEAQNSFRTVAQAVLPVVVEVNVVDVVERQFSGSRTPFEFFFGTPRGEEGESREFRRSGLGSGVLVAREGTTVYVLTNDHVVGDADEINVTLYDGRKFEAELVGTDAKRDLALVSFSTRQDVPLAVLGDSDSLMPGDWVLAIGNPYGFESTITAGIVSAIGRRATGQLGLAGLTEYIQTDAAINQGNSGGALVNIYGEVVGINSWIASPSGGSIGLGFAIPVNVAKSSLDDFIRTGTVQYGWLGVTIGALSDQAKAEMQIDAEQGSFIYNIVDSSPAEQAGLLPGDYVLTVDGRRIENPNDLVYTIGNLPVGATATLDLIRGGRTMAAQVEIGARQSDDTKLEVWPGFSAVPLSDAVRAQFGISRDHGSVAVARVEDDSPAAVMGLRPGDIVSAINGRKVNSLLELYAGLNSDRSGSVELDLIREGKEVTVSLKR